MRPGKAVYFERSITSAPAEITAASLATALIRSPSTITVAFVQSFPFASHSLPKRTALIVFEGGFSCAEPVESIDRRVANVKVERKTLKNGPGRFMTHTSARTR